MIKERWNISVQMRFILTGDLIGHEAIAFEQKIKGWILFWYTDIWEMGYIWGEWKGILETAFSKKWM